MWSERFFTLSDVLEKIENEDEHGRQVDYKNGFNTPDTITVVFDQRHRTIEFFKNSTSQGIAFTANEIHKGKARFLIEMGTPDDSVMIE